MSAESEDLIPSPLACCCREFCIRHLPRLVFAGLLGLTVWLWDQALVSPTRTSQPERPLTAGGSPDSQRIPGRPAPADQAVGSGTNDHGEGLKGRQRPEALSVSAKPGTGG